MSALPTWARWRSGRTLIGPSPTAVRRAQARARAYDVAGQAAVAADRHERELRDPVGARAQLAEQALLDLRGRERGRRQLRDLRDVGRLLPPDHHSGIMAHERSFAAGC